MSNRELGLPTGLGGPDADQAVELMRAWWIKDRPEFVLRPALRDARDVGRLLGEAAFHFSQVYASKGLGEAADLLEQIRAGFEDAKKIEMATVMTHSRAPKEG